MAKSTWVAAGSNGSRSGHSVRCTERSTNTCMQPPQPAAHTPPLLRTHTSQGKRHLTLCLSLGCAASLNRKGRCAACAYLQSSPLQPGCHLPQCVGGSRHRLLDDQHLTRPSLVCTGHGTQHTGHSTQHTGHSTQDTAQGGSVQVLGGRQQLTTCRCMLTPCSSLYRAAQAASDCVGDPTPCMRVPVPHLLPHHHGPPPQPEGS